jgi:hypothetical protein
MKHEMKQSKKRRLITVFLVSPILSALLLLAPVRSAPHQETRAGKGPAEQAGAPVEMEPGQLYLIFDPRLQGQGEQCELKLHQFKRHPANPVVKPDRPWERGAGLGRIEIYGTVLWEPEEKFFKMWYWSGTGPLRNPSERARLGDVNQLVCYAVSKDGVHWEKPVLGIHEFEGSKENNISSIGDVLPVIYHNPETSDPERRYVKWSLQTRDADDGVRANYSMYRFFSRDGVRWTRERREPVFPGYPNKYLVGWSDHPYAVSTGLRQEALPSDIAHTYWLPRLQKFVSFYRFDTPNMNPGPNDQPKNMWGQRSFARIESADGVHWDKDKLVWILMRDHKDKEFDEYLQFYGLSIHPVGDLYLAFPWLFHSNEGTHDVGLAYSTDTVRWHRPFRGQYVLPRAPEGEWDSGMIQGTAAHLVEKDNLWWLYYSSSPYVHKDDDKRYFAIGLAQMPMGRVVSARSWRQKGSWTVGPLRIAGRELLVNAAILDSLRVTILDEKGQPVPGYYSEVIRGNDTALPVRWEGGTDLAPLRRRTVKIRFDLDDAEVFGFQSR